MKRQEFIEKTISSLDDNHFKRIIDTLFNRYIPFDFLEKEDIDTKVLKEKINDYFGTVEALTGRSFDNIVDIYAGALEEVIEDRIIRLAGSTRNSPKTRAMKYYEEALALKKSGLPTVAELTDYYRIMLCLYMAIIDNEHKRITDFDFSSECLKGRLIMESLRNEEISTLMGTKKRFNDKGLFSKDRSTFIMLIIMYYFIKNKEVEDKY